MAKEENGQTGRRGALKALAVVGGVAASAVVAVPGAQLLLSPVKTAGKSERWVKTVPLDSLHEGVPRRVSIVADRKDAWTIERMVELGAVWLIRTGDKVECMSVTCPHLGCSIGHNENGFFCPCHASDFTPAGKKLTGPAPRDLDKLATKIVEGYVVVDFRKYRQGTPDMIEIGG